MLLPVRSRVLVPSSHLATPPARAHRPVADTVQHVAAHRLVSILEPDRRHLDVMGHG